MSAVRWAGLAVLLGGSTGCWLDEARCTPADSTYSCCVKQHPAGPQACGVGASEAGGPGLGLTVGALTAAATLSSDEAVLPATTRAAVEEVLKECAAQAHETVNRRHFGGDPSPEQCDEVLRRDARGMPVTWAIQLGLDKHEVALACTAKRLDELLSRRFSLQQRYRYDSKTRRLELVSQEERLELLRNNQSHELRGTLEPDVVIHSGDPLKPQAVYDFKFPCLRDNMPKWTIYKKGPHQDRSQGMVYQEAFGSASRVTPWTLIR